MGAHRTKSIFVSFSFTNARARLTPYTWTHGHAVDWVAQIVAELEVIDPAMTAFVAECDAREARAPTAPPHQGHMTPRDESVSIQSKGIKKTFPCLWLPVSLCVASRVHSLLSSCTVVPLMDCTLPSKGLSLVDQRRKEVRAGSVCQLCPPLNRPVCEFIHSYGSERVVHLIKQLPVSNNQDVNVLFVDRRSIRRVTGILPKWQWGKQPYSGPAPV